MKIQFHQNNRFFFASQQAKFMLNPSPDFGDAVDFVLYSDPKREGENSKFEAKKTLCLPGEFEISSILIKGFHTDNQSNNVYKVVVDDLVLAHFGNLKKIPNTTFFDQLGENIDIALICVSDDFDEKKVKELVRQVDPRIVIIGGLANYFPKIAENMGAKTWESPIFSIKKSALPMDKTEVIIIPESE